MTDDPFKDHFDYSFEGEDGNIYRMRALSTPEDFIKEAKADEQRKEKYIRKANARFAAYGEKDKRGQEFLFAAQMCEHSATNHHKMAELMRRQEEQRNGE